MKRREFLKLFGCGLAATAVSGIMRGGDEGVGKRPNIVLFLVDDMGWQDTSQPFWYVDGKPVKTRLNARYKTPNMEAMAKEGMLFTDAYACPICSPTRCSLMSGMNMARHRVTDWTLGVNDGSRLNTQGGGCKAPYWAANGLQPEGTQPTGTCLPPWKRDAEGRYYQPKNDGEKVSYNMTVPYTNALAFPKLLQEAGYHTIHCGKAHWGSGSFNTYKGTGATTPGANPKNFGFDVNIAGCEIGGPANYRGDRKYGNSDTSWVQFGVPGLDENGYYDRNVFLTDALTDEVLAELSRHRTDHPEQPFYLYMSHYAIHAPWNYDQAWDATRGPQWSDPGDGLAWNDTERNYAALIQGMDDSLGKIRDFLEKQGIAENTIVIFMADNGGNDGSANSRMQWSNAPLRAGKGSCYEGGIREPMMVVWPGRVKPGSVSHEPVHIDDFYPTILEMAGVALPSASTLAVTPSVGNGDTERRQVLDGQSIVPVLTGERATVDATGAERALLWHYPNQWGEGGRTPRYYNFYTVVRQGPWKLIYNHNTEGDAETFELYNLTNDISEKTNLATVYPKVTDRLRKTMGKLLRECGAQMPIRTSDGSTLPYPDDVAFDATSRPPVGITLKGATEQTK